IFLLTLNAKEQALLIPFEITLPSQRKPLFEYTSYITSVNNYLYDGVINLILDKKYQTGDELKNAINCSLISMFLRTSKNLEYLSLNEVICSQVIFENLYENTTITSIDLNALNNYFRSMAIDNTGLTSLNLRYNSIGSEGGKAFADALGINITLKNLNLSYNNLDSEGGKALAVALCKNATLTSLDICENNLGSEGGRALADALCKNTALISLNLRKNNLGLEGGRALADALYKNTALTSLNIGYNHIGPEGGKALADALYRNATLTSLNLANNNLGSEGGKAFADALYKNTA
ncbi:hypothetical protein C2G38_2094908, partial [Gigaspora rosea]